MSPTNPFKHRARELRQELARHKLDGLLVTHRANVQYLTGFTGTAGTVLVTADEIHLIVDFRYFEQAAKEAPQAHRVHVKRTLYDVALRELLVALGTQRLAFEADTVTFAQHMAWTTLVPHVEWVPSRGLVAASRQVKDASEIALIRKAAAITSRAVAEAISALRPGMNEREIAGDIENRMRKLGGDGPAFDTLVATGMRSAHPHAKPTDRRPEFGDIILVDAGATVGGYCADMTRSFVWGAADKRQTQVWQVLRDALAAGVAAIAPGVHTRMVDKATRDVLKRHGLDDHFGHDTGHGVGLEIHEEPRLARDSDEVLEAGMIVTVEPGVYIPGWGGMRLEELVLVTAHGAELLTTAPLGLTSICTATH